MRRLMLSMLILALATLLQAGDAEAEALVKTMVEKVGGMAGLHAKKDVTYTYTYQTPDGKKDVSIEKYIFDGERSWAEYTTAEVMQAKGRVVQGYDGKNSWVTVDGQLSGDEQVKRRGDFLRKTNYYWFAMMHKLADPGLFYKDKGKQVLEGLEYHLVEVGFDSGIGDVQDTYLLYINPYTGLVDQFLFTVMDFGVKDPLLMKVQYEAFDGLLLPTVRRYAPADWDGNPKEDKWVLEIMSDLRFNTGLKSELFTAPAQ